MLYFGGKAFLGYIDLDIRSHREVLSGKNFREDLNRTRVTIKYSVMNPSFSILGARVCPITTCPCHFLLGFQECVGFFIGRGKETHWVLVSILGGCCHFLWLNEE